MNIEEFVEDPFGQQSIHPAYRDSFLHMRPAPEYASGEVVLASLYRNVGLGQSPEGTVPANGKSLQKRISKGRRISEGVGFNSDTWQSVLNSSLKSPKQPNQSTKRFLQLCPLIPDCAIYSSSARLTSNSWNPGEMVQRMISFGAANQEDAQEIWETLFHALSVSDAADDPWARALDREFKSWREKGQEWGLQSYEHYKVADTLKAGGGDSPSSHFAADLRIILDLKTTLTRRQWISTLESLLRISTSAHVLWICKSNRECLHLFLQALLGEPLPSLAELSGNRMAAGKDGYWRYGQRGADAIRDFAREFVRARLGINILLHMLDEQKWDLGISPLGSPRSILALAETLQSRRSDFPISRFTTIQQQVMDQEPRIVSAKKGIGSNIAEFLRHSLGQRQTSEDGMKSYDQGYWLRKGGHYAAAPWIVSAGPVSVMFLSCCCARRKVGPTTIDDLCRHLQAYGISADAAEITVGDLGGTLRNLGLITDSPDAEGGMLVRDPFELNSKAES